jgi:predicted phosphodiesterase
VARESVLKFMGDFCKGPGAKRIHLGDFVDVEALMGGGAGHGEPLAPDIAGGVRFLEDGEFNVVINGNHEDRIWRLTRSKNEVVAELSQYLKHDIEQTVQKLKADHVPYTGVFQKYMLGTGLFTHGTIYNESAPRDMAEMYVEADAVFFGHTHSPGIALARNSRRTIGINVGTLKLRGSSDYAKGRRKTLSWGQAIAYGEYCDTGIQPSLYIHPLEMSGQPWRLSV